MERHPLEEKLNASAEDIMSAIMGGFRAIIDVKGKLAEYFLKKRLDELKGKKVIESFEWIDRDGMPDFIIKMDGKTVILEAKNVRSPIPKSGPDMEIRIELQKTRNSKDGTNTRGYKETEFDVVAACLFNRTGRWDFLYADVKDLHRRDNDPQFLKIMQSVPTAPGGIWSGDLGEILRKAASRK